MPTRPYKQKFLKKGEKQKDECPVNTSSEHEKYSSRSELDRLLLHNSDDLKLREKHCLFPAFNVEKSPLRNLQDLHVCPSCSISSPSPIYVANRHCEGIDICHRRTTARETFRKRINTSRTRYQTAQKVKKLKTNEKDRTYHSSLFGLARRLQCEPDPYFHGSYDYYYSGGNLCVLGDGEHVLHVDGQNLNNLNVGVLPNLKRFDNSFLDHKGSLKIEGDDEVFEVRVLKNIRPDCSNTFAVRKRNDITLNTLSPNGNVKALTRFQTNSTPFISFAQSPIELNTFIVTTMKQCVRVYDLNSYTPKLTATHDVYTRDDAMRVSWNMIRPWQANTFMYANEKQLLILDTRTSPDQWLKKSCGYKMSNFECDFISSIATSEFRDLAYVATNHKLHCLDLRYMGEDLGSDASAICHWTHQLEYAPAFVKTFRHGANEFIALSSALANDMCICELTRQRESLVVENHDVAEKSPTSSKTKKSTYKSYCLPYQPPTLEDAYRRARIAGKCLQPDSALLSRINRCCTGLDFYDTATFSECIGADDCATFALLLTSNSLGDMYAHRLIETDTQQLSETITSFKTVGEDAMHSYAKRVCELTQPCLNYTEVVNLKGMRKVFRCDILSKPLNFDEDDKTKADDITTKERGLGRWRKSIKSLHSYKDALAKDLLSIWDIEYDDDQTETSYSKIKKDLNIKPDPKTIVSSWLNSNIKTENCSLISQRQELPVDVEKNFGHINCPVMTVVHAPCFDAIDDSIQMEFSVNVENNLMDLNNTCSFTEFMAGPSTQQQSTQFFEDVNPMPDSPTEQEEFISLKPKPMAVKKKSKYVKGF